jgi:hypothetical protein
MFEQRIPSFLNHRFDDNEDRIMKDLLSLINGGIDEEEMDRTVSLLDLVTGDIEQSPLPPPPPTPSPSPFSTSFSSASSSSSSSSLSTSSGENENGNDKRLSEVEFFFLSDGDSDDASCDGDIESELDKLTELLNTDNEITFNFSNNDINLFSLLNESNISFDDIESDQTIVDLDHDYCKRYM